MRDGFGERHARQRQLGGLLPQRDRGGQLPSFRVVMRQDIRLAVPELGDALLDYPSDLGVQLLAASLEQRVVGGVLHQCMLESVDRVGWCAAAKCKPRFRKLGEGTVES